MNNLDFKSQNNLPFENKDISTFNSPYLNHTKEPVNINLEIYQAITSINNRLDILEAENIKLHKDLEETRTRENKLLNRFSWLLLIINYSSAIIMLIVVFTFVNSVYPFIKNLIESDIGGKVIVSIVGGAIGTGIIGIWVTFNKYVHKVIEREKDK